MARLDGLILFEGSDGGDMERIETIAPVVTLRRTFADSAEAHPQGSRPQGRRPTPGTR